MCDTVIPFILTFLQQSQRTIIIDGNDKLRKCTYYSEDSFNKNCYPLVKGGNFLSVLHVNARSAPKNLDNYILFLQNINIDFSVVGV